MRLLFLSTVFPSPYLPFRGPQHRALVNALSQEHDVRVIAPVPWPATLRSSRSEAGTLACGYGVPVSHPVYFYPPKLLQSRYDSFMWWSVRRAVRHTFRGWVPEATLGAWAHPDGAVALRIAREVRVPGLVLAIGSDLHLVTRNNARRAAVARTLTSADFVLAVGHDLRDRAISLGVPAARVRVIRNGVAENFSPGDKAAARRRLDLPLDVPLLLSVCNLVPVKGLDVLLEASRLLADRKVDFRLCLIGDGPLRKDVVRRAAQAPLRGRVIVIGAVPPKDLPDWYRAADLTVLASRSEGLPNVLQESMACGTGFVATRVGGIPELAAECDGEADLVPPENPMALANAIELRLVRPESPDRTALGRFDWSDTLRIVTDVLATLTRRAGAS